MNFSTLTGLIFALGVFIGSILLSLSNSMIFLDPKAVLIVIGGTFAASLVCFPLNQILALLRVFFRRLLGKNKHDYIGIVDQISALSQASRRGPESFESALPNITHPFLKDAAYVSFWVETEVSLEELRYLLETRAETHFKHYHSEAKIFRTIAKFPPAFGLMGTTLGLIALLQTLGSSESKDFIGPAMAIALVTTLWGLALANFVFIPIAENLTKQTEEDLVVRRMIVEGIMLIRADKPTKYVEEMVKSFLIPSQRTQKSA